MQRIEIKITVFFEDPFWVCFYERINENILEVCKITFFCEPKDYDIYYYLIRNYDNLKFSPFVEVELKSYKKISYKKMQKQVKKSFEKSSVGTKSMQALKLLYDENKNIKGKICKKEKEEYEKKKYEIKVQKRKNKHKGR